MNNNRDIVLDSHKFARFCSAYQRVRAHMYDCDGVFYKPEQYPKDALVHVAIGLVKTRCPALSDKGILDFVGQALGNNGQPNDRFVERLAATEVFSSYDFGHPVSRYDLHMNICRNLDPSVVSVCSQTPQLMRQLSLPWAIVSHGGQDWLENVLCRLGITHEPHQLFSLENYWAARKDSHREPFVMVLDYLGVRAGWAVFVEDTIENLRIPKEMGMVTIFLDHDRGIEDPEHWADFRFRDLPEFLTYAVAAQKASVRPVLDRRQAYVGQLVQ